MAKSDGIVRKLRDVRVNAVDKRRTDMTIPPEILERARVKAGDSVEIRVTPRMQILLVPLRTDWPARCRGRVDGCLLLPHHEGECSTDKDLPY